MSENIESMRELINQFDTIKSPDDLDDISEKVNLILKKTVIKDIIEYIQYLCIQRGLKPNDCLEISANILYTLSINLVKPEGLEKYFDGLMKTYFESIKEKKDKEETPLP